MLGLSILKFPFLWCFTDKNSHGSTNLLPISEMAARRSIVVNLVFILPDDQQVYMRLSPIATEMQNLLTYMCTMLWCVTSSQLDFRHVRSWNHFGLDFLIQVS